MRGIELIGKFVRSHALLDKAAKELFERFPLSLRHRVYYGKTFFHWLAFLKESEYWEPERLKVFQFEQLKALLEHAGSRVPYYRQLFSDCGLNPGKIQGIDDIRKLPYLTREKVKERTRDFVTENIPARRLISAATSGSVGIPLTVYRTKESIEEYQAFLLHSLARVGFSSSSRSVVFQWRPMMVGRRRVDVHKSGNKLILSTGQSIGATVEWAEKNYLLITRFGPEYISGSVTVLLAMAFIMGERGLPPLRGLRAVFAHSEAVLPWQRKTIEGAFGARVFMTYAMHEGVIFGSGCEHSNQYHIYPQRGITEFIELNGNRKEIVATGLNSYIMPFIRYRTMDIGVKGAEACDQCRRSMPLIERIEGRMYEFLVTKEGDLCLSIIAVDAPVFDRVRQFQFYQDEPGLAYLKIVRGSGYSDADTPLIEEAMRKSFGSEKTGMTVKLMFVDDIGRTAAGKTVRTDQRLNVHDYVKVRYS